MNQSNSSNCFEKKIESDCQRSKVIYTKGYTQLIIHPSMPQDATCPYCQAEQVVAVPEGETSTMYIQCTNCGGVFEFMPDFGSFSLPDEGRGYRPMRQFSGTSPRQDFVVSGEDVPQTGGGAICCCVIFLIIFFVFLDFIWQFLFG